MNPSLAIPASSAADADSRLHAGGVFALALVPWMLVWSRTGAEICMALVSLIFLARSARAKDWAWLSSPLAGIALLTWAWCMLAVSPFALSPAASFSRAVSWVRFPLFFLAVTHWLLKDARACRAVALSGAALLCVVLVDTLIQFFAGQSLTGKPLPEGGRLSGPFGNPKVGIFITKMAFPFTGFLLWQAARRGERGAVAGWGALLLALYALVLLSGERTAFASFTLGLLLAGGVLAWSNARLRLPFLALSVILACVVMAGVFTVPAVRYRTDMLIEHLVHFGESPYGEVLRASFALASRYWLHGAGLGNFPLACAPLVSEGIVGYCQPHAHNPYMEWLVEAGAGGLCCFLALVLWMVAQPLKFICAGGQSMIMPAFALATWVTHFFPFMFTQSTVSNWPAMLLWFSLAVVMGFLARAQP